MMYLMKSNVTRFARCYAPWLSARLQAGCSFQSVDSEVRARQVVIIWTAPPSVRRRRFLSPNQAAKRRQRKDAAAVQICAWSPAR
jgi:hypothetical protein